MNMLREIVVSGYLLKRSLAGFPKFEKKKTNKQTKKEKIPQRLTLTHQMEHKTL